VAVALAYSILKRKEKETMGEHQVFKTGFLRPRLVVALLAPVLIMTLLSACATSTTNQLGVLELTIQGLSAGLDASITVTGPNGFSVGVKASTKLDKLSAGDYTVSAEDVIQGDTYFPDKRQQSVVVKAGETASFTLTYSKQVAGAGSLEVTMDGLPLNTDANVDITGPGGFSQHLTTSSVLSNLNPGDYQLKASPVAVSSDTYSPTPMNQTVGVAAGSKTELTVTYTKQASTIGQLAIAVTGLPTGLDAALSVTGPNGFSETVTITKTFSALQPGDYEITATKVDGTYPYYPYPKTQRVNVVAGETATAGVAYVPTIIDGVEGDAFGSSVALDGDFMVMGAPRADHGTLINDGAAYVYERTATGEWALLKELIPENKERSLAPRAGLEPAGLSEEDHFGTSVAISGDTVVVGAPNAVSGKICDLHGNCSDIRGGLAYVFKRDEGGRNNFGIAYTLQTLGALTPTRNGDNFGASVAVSDNGNVIVVGEPGLAYDVDGDGTLACDQNTLFEECGVGGAYLFFSDGNVSGTKLLLADDKQDHSVFGAAVALSGDRVVVGAEGDSYDADQDGTEECGISTDNSECFLGSGYLFEKNQGAPDAWGQVAKLVPSESQFDDGFGASVAIEGDTVVLGTHNSDGGQTKASASILERNQGGPDQWGEVKKLDIAGVPEGFNTARVAVHGDVVVMGIPFMNTDLNGDGKVACTPGDFTGDECLTGAVLTFQRNAGGADNFGLVQTFVASDGAKEDFLGFDVVFGGNSMVAGAPGHATVGAVYVLTP
jgi:FG-GAP repeat